MAVGWPLNGRAKTPEHDLDRSMILIMVSRMTPVTVSK